MPITLQDAIERAKLSSDEEGLLSSYMYDQLVDALKYEDKYAFTMALVDIGIIPKHGGRDNVAHMKEVLAYDADLVEEESSEKVGSNLVEELSKIAQQFVQSPGGVWQPSTFTEDPAPEPEQEEMIGDPDQYSVDVNFDEKPVTPDEFVDTDEADYIINTLENAGVSVSPDGSVTLYSQNIPGLYMNEVPLKAIPLEKAIQSFNSDANKIDKEQQRIGEFQDALAALTTNLSGLENSTDEFNSKLLTGLETLESFKYTPKSKDENLRSIGENLVSLRDYLSQNSSNIEELTHALNVYNRPIEEIIQDLQSRLDNYYQTQYDKYDEKLRVVDALERLSDIRFRDPKMFEGIVKSIGGIVGMFRQVGQMFNDGYSSEFMESDPQNGSLEISIGIDYLQDVIMDHPSYDKYGEDLIYLFFSNLVGEDDILNQDEFEWLYDKLSTGFGLVFAGSQAPEVKIEVVSGYSLEAFIGKWTWNPGASELNESGYYEIEEYESVDDMGGIASAVREGILEVIDESLLSEMEE